MELLHTQFMDIQENVTRLLANLAADAECATTLLRSPEELDKISKLLMSPQQNVQRNVAHIMCNLANVKGQTDTLGRLPGLLPTLIHLLGSPSPQVTRYLPLLIFRLENRLASPFSSAAVLPPTIGRSFIPQLMELQQSFAF